ncbi:MAG: sugar ABC transporter substrate-binding protein [Actinobacteria bacterium]|nr:sugar ABC transporter substrate-binding protein [Actinomycetota bacterium]
MTDRFRVVRKGVGSIGSFGRGGVIVLAIAALTMLLAACGGGSSTSGTTAGGGGASNEGGGAEESKAEGSTPAAFAKEEIPQGSNSAAGLGKKTIGMIVITQASEVFPELQAGTKKSFGVLGWELKLVDLNGDISKVPADVENLVQSGVDAIILASVEPSFVGKQALAVAKKAGVPIIGQSTGVKQAESGGVLTASVDTDLTPYGKKEGEQIVEEFGEGAEVAMVIDQLASTGKAMQKGVEAGMAGKTKVVAEHQLDYAKLVPDVTATSEQWLLQYPNLKVIWCPYDGACVGAGQAILTTGKETAVMSMSGTAGAFEQMREGVNFTTWAIPLEYVSWLTTDVLVGILGEGRYEKSNEYPLVKVDQSNVPSSGGLPEEEIWGNLEEEFSQRWGVK